MSAEKTANRTSVLLLGRAEPHGKMWRMHLWHKTASRSKPVAELRLLADGKFSVHMESGISERQMRHVGQLIDDGIGTLRSARKRKQEADRG